MTKSKSDSNQLLCFCFHYTKKDFQDAISENKEQEMINDIKKKMKDPGCYCETSNPSGKCCLNQIDLFIKSIKK